MNPLIRRQRAAEACMARFNGRPYAPGRRDCVILAAHALRRLGVAVPSLKGVRWSSEAGALKTLRRTGFASLADGMDALGRARIAPAMALPADIVAVPTDGGAFDCALTVALGNGFLLGFKDGVCEPLVAPATFVAAWRSI